MWWEVFTSRRMFFVCMMLKMLFVLLSAWVLLGQSQVLGRDCNRDYEFPCENGQCINKQQWCDEKFDCSDGTDEYYCDGTPCLDYLFRCSSGRCIPKVAVCDNYKDCPDGSDEICGDESRIYSLEPDISYFHVERLDGPNSTKDVIEQAVVEATNYLLNEMRSGKGMSIFRAVVALAFADKMQPLNVIEKKLLKKQLNIQLTVELMQSVTKLTVTELSLCINALNAICENPRNFHGKDLVNILRTRTDAALKSNFDFPFALLTLCVAGEYNHDDLIKIDDIFRNSGSDRIGVKALALMAMICGDRRSQRSDSTSRIANFFSLRKGLEYSNADVYTKALFLQASNAAGIKTDIGELLKHQLPDGSFGDIMATYHAIPALLNTSILELKCKDQGLRMDLLMDGPIHKGENGARNITYSIWMTAGGEMNSHSMVIEVDGRKTFYDLMNVAAHIDPTFRFMCDDTVNGKKLYSIAGIPNDPESGIFWSLYRTDSRTVAASPVTRIEENQGLDAIVPKGNEHFVFQMRQGRVN